MHYQIKRLWIQQSAKSKLLWQEFLHQAGIGWEEHVDYTIGVYDGEKLIGTGSLFQNIMKCFAVDPAYQGGEVISMIISHLLSEIVSQGFSGSFVYTKPESADSFLFLGFKEIARVGNQLVFLEKAVHGFKEYLQQLFAYRTNDQTVAAIVMNANPFTLGHQYLAEYAAARCDILHIFVLSEDLSVFPSKVRLELVKRGVAHLSNVHVHQTGDYMVSAKTFPSYFLKEDADVTRVQATLDATVFLKIAQTVGINHRYVGEEPYSPATAIYNEAMRETFREQIALTIIPRKQQDGDVISASRVRALLGENCLNELKALVPQTTYDFLCSPEGAVIQQKLAQPQPIKP